MFITTKSGLVFCSTFCFFYIPFNKNVFFMCFFLNHCILPILASTLKEKVKVFFSLLVRADDF